MIKWTLCLFLLLFKCDAFAQKRLTYNDKTFLFTLTCDSTLSGDSANYFCSVRTISVQRSKDNKASQIIYPGENSCYCDFPEDEIFIVEDINFDGYNDIRLLKFVPAAPNMPYYYWIFNPKSKKYEKNRELEDITSPQFDQEKKLIYSFWRSGGTSHGTTTYRYINGRPVLIEVVEEKEEDGKTTTTIRRRVDGKMKIISVIAEKANDN